MWLSKSVTCFSAFFSTSWSSCFAGPSAWSLIIFFSSATCCECLASASLDDVKLSLIFSIDFLRLSFFSSCLASFSGSSLCVWDSFGPFTNSLASSSTGAAALPFAASTLLFFDLWTRELLVVLSGMTWSYYAVSVATWSITVSLSSTSTKPLSKSNSSWSLLICNNVTSTNSACFGYVIAFSWIAVTPLLT